MSGPAEGPLRGRELLGIELDILRYPDPILKKPTEPVTAFDDELAGFVEKLYASMRVHDGVGLAAPQVGVLRKVAVVEYEGKSYTLINPRVLEKRGEQEAEEGCLSFPGIYALVKRPEWVKVETQDLKGQTRVYEAEGFVARAFLHEMDHLDGHLFIDYLSPLKRGAIRKKMTKQARGTSMAEPARRPRRR
ncbi:MAG: peptide deformylase [Fretibacterium sp.]|nr:peptide deformylase [Fretibacterium sp.]